MWPTGRKFDTFGVESALPAQPSPSHLNIWDPPVISWVGTKPTVPQDQTFLSQNSYTFLRLRHIWHSSTYSHFPENVNALLKCNVKKKGGNQSVTSGSERTRGSRCRYNWIKVCHLGLSATRDRKPAQSDLKKRERVRKGEGVAGEGRDS